MTSRRAFLFLLAALPVAGAASPSSEVRVYKSRGCGCCGEWEKHLRAHGFAVRSHFVDDIAAVKRELGVPDALASCHTALVAGYVVEGHVPAADVRRLLREKPAALGLAVPGMPAGSPGMEGGTPRPYATLAFDARRSWIFARH